MKHEALYWLSEVNCKKRHYTLSITVLPRFLEIRFLSCNFGSTKPLPSYAPLWKQRTFDFWSLDTVSVVWPRLELRIILWTSVGFRWIQSLSALSDRALTHLLDLSWSDIDFLKRHWISVRAHLGEETALLTALWTSGTSEPSHVFPQMNIKSNNPSAFHVPFVPGNGKRFNIFPERNDAFLCGGNVHQYYRFWMCETFGRFHMQSCVAELLCKG